HWCHVMNDETFGNAEVIAALGESYVAIKVDSDARPDLAERFRDYAWPATVLLTPRGEIIRAMRGYRPAEPFTRLLRAAARGDVLPEEEAREAAPPAELDALRSAAIASLDGLYDDEAGGWGRRQKYPYFAPLEHAFFRAQVRGEGAWGQRARQTLAGTAHLIDPVFGGAYQYSLRNRWTAPHFEKIAAVQADVLAGFARAVLAGEPRAEADSAMAAQLRYLREFFTATSGAFYTSQDADLNHELSGDVYYAMGDAARRAAGFPRVDQNQYVDLNARVILALVLAHRAQADGALAMAERAADAMLVLQRDDGGFEHATGAGDLRYLRDQAYAIRALLRLYEVSAESRYREAAERAADFVLAELQAPRGFYGHTEDPAAFGALAERRAPIAENGVLARGFLELARRSGESRFAEGADHALGVASLASLRREGRRIGDYLLGAEERLSPYVLVSVVGPDTEETRALHDAALRLATPLALVELGRPGESRYPYPGEAAAYLCNASACSRPVFAADGLAAAADAFLDAD
ncbi:MAG: DUF255 domain-containing protein, partial [Myxococcota bacterium]